MKKKLLFVIPEYSHGGTNKSLENLLHFIDKDKYDVSIYSLYEDGGPLYKNIFAPYILKKSLLYTIAHDNKVTRKIMGLAMKLSSKVNFDWLYRYEVNRLQKEYKFDTVIAYQEGIATEYVSYINHCENKIAWIHFDYAMRKGKVDLRSRMKYYDKYDCILCVSQAALDSMLEVQPEYSNKSSFLYNMIDIDHIKKSAMDVSETIPYTNGVFNILSVGRFVDIKQFHLIPSIAKDIKKNTNRAFCWYIMGSGDMHDTISHNIRTNDVEDCVKILDANDNPYPYFKNADLHVCTSTHESFSYTIAESKVLHTPVLCNDFAVAKEVVDEDAGWIYNVDDMAKIVVDIIENKNNIYTKKKNTIMQYKYNNELLIEQFDNLV